MNAKKAKTIIDILEISDIEEESAILASVKLSSGEIIPNMILKKEDTQEAWRVLSISTAPAESLKKGFRLVLIKSLTPKSRLEKGMRLVSSK